MLNCRIIFVLPALLAMLSASAAAQTAAKPKLSVSAIQIAMVETNDVEIPAEFRYAVYEQLVERVRASGTFQTVFRVGDHRADGVPDLVTLHTTIEKFKQGSQTARELTTVLGATRVDLTASVTSRDGHEIINHKVTGRVRFFGENLNVTNDLAKRITKLVQASFQTKS